VTPDEHYKLLGGLVGSFQSLEFILRGFLQELPSARPIGIPYGTSIYSFPVGTELLESELTSYATLGALIKKFNTEMDARGLPTIDVALVNVRDALAHGRVSSSSPNNTMRLIKSDKPDNKRRVRVAFNERMTKAWFKVQIARVGQAIRAVHKVMPQ
jgi:hypothetical protein